MKTDATYWIWMQFLLGVGARRAPILMDYVEHPREIYEGVLANNHLCSMLKPDEISAAATAMEQAVDCERRTRRKGCEIVTPDHPHYPPLLRSVYGKPLVLYVKGELACLRDALVVAMVGARTPTTAGKRAAALIAGELVDSGAVVVSGLAAGIDTESHLAALAGGGKTIGVLGCGIDVDYPAGSAPLKTAMSQNGAVVTEYPLGYPTRPANFPLRNRIISGMAHGTVVVEASMRSGSLITARLAEEQGREVFAVSGSPGTNHLIKNGVRLVDGAQDILQEYAHLANVPLPVSGEGIVVETPSAKPPAKRRAKPKPKPPEKPKRGPGEKILPEGLTEPAAQVYAALGRDTLSVDELVAQTGRPVGAVLSALTELEIYGLIISRPGRRFEPAD